MNRQDEINKAAGQVLRDRMQENYFKIFAYYFGDYSKIIESAKHPNPNVDKLLSGFRDWLINKLGL